MELKVFTSDELQSSLKPLYEKIERLEQLVLEKSFNDKWIKKKTYQDSKGFSPNTIKKFLAKHNIKEGKFVSIPMLSLWDIDDALEKSKEE